MLNESNVSYKGGNPFLMKLRLLKKDALQHAENNALGFAIFTKEGRGKKYFSRPFKKHNILVLGVFFPEQWLNIETLHFHRGALSGWLSAVSFVKHVSLLAKMRKKHLQGRCAVHCAVAGLAATQRYMLSVGKGSKISFFPPRTSSQDAGTKEICGSSSVWTAQKAAQNCFCELLH